MYYTVKEIANILGVSKTTVQKAIKAASFGFDKVEKNKHLYSAEKAREIIKSVNAAFDFSTLEGFSTFENSTTETENSTTKIETETENSQTETENSQTETENSTTLNKAFAILEKQLTEKDAAIKDLQDKLAAAYSQISQQSQVIADLAAKAQYITAADKTAQLIEKQEESKKAAAADIVEDNKPQEKKSFFKRIFKR